MQQQIIVSGIGGQGVLFITKILAETALDMGKSVLISETHGMAQRGGNVISHLKVGPRNGGDSPDIKQSSSKPAQTHGFTSPLIRPGQADVLLALHPDALKVHGFYLKTGGQAFSNTPESNEAQSLNATQIAADLGAIISANLVLLGFAAGSGRLFCEPDRLERTLKQHGGKRLTMSLNAFRAGWDEAKKRKALGSV